jgi:hypothetical protein
MSEEPKLEVYELGVATGPTDADLAAAPWMTAGHTLILAAFLLCFTTTVVLAIKRRAPGHRFILAGLILVALYYVFQVTVANDAELLYSPAGYALAHVAYGLGSLVVAIGYTRLVWHVCKGKAER